MEMQVEETPITFLKLGVRGGKILRIDKESVKLLKTLQLMIDDFEVEDNNVVIPIPDFVSPSVMQWIIDAILIARLQKQLEIAEEGEEKGFNTLYKNLALYNALRSLQEQERVPLLSSLFVKNNGVPTSEDVRELVDLVEALNWIDAPRRLLLDTQAKLEDVLRGMRSEEIMKLYVEYGGAELDKKRKKSSAAYSELPLTPYYKHEKLVQSFMRQALPKEVTSPKLKVERHINPIAAGNNHTVFLSADGTLYGIGSNAWGQLALPENTEPVDVMTKILMPPKGVPIMIAASDDYTLCLTSEGLYGIGNNYHHALGIQFPPDTVQITYEWRLIPVDGEVLLLSTHNLSTFVLTTTGLYSCGNNFTHQLGHASRFFFEERHQQQTQTDVPVLTLVPGVPRVISITQSNVFTVINTIDGLYATGLNTRNVFSKTDYDSQGDPEEVREFTRLDRINRIYVPIVSVAAGINHVVIVTATHHVYGSGSSAFGQLGIDLNLGSVPLRMITSAGVDGLPLSVYADENDTLIVTTGGVEGSGENQSCRLGVGNCDRKRRFTRSRGLEGTIVAVTFLQNNVYVLTTLGLFKAGFLSRRLGNTPNFIDTKIDLGYFTEPLPSILAEEEDDDTVLESESKKIKLHCTLCLSKAHFMYSAVENSGPLPFCSKLCLYKSQMTKG